MLIKTYKPSRKEYSKWCIISWGIDSINHVSELPNEKTSSEVNIEVIGEEPTRKISNEELSKTEEGKKVDEDDKQPKLPTHNSSKAATGKAALKSRSKAKKDQDVRNEYVEKNVDLMS